MEIIDNQNYIAQHDPSGALNVAAQQWLQLAEPPRYISRSAPETAITQVVVAGMGGSALAAGVAKDWLDLPLPFEVVRSYVLPRYVGPQTLVVLSSYSGNTEETLACYEEARARGAVCAVVAAGGRLLELAEEHEVDAAVLPSGMQPRMGALANLHALLMILQSHGVVDGDTVEEFRAQQQWLRDQTEAWLLTVESAGNLAKQIAWHCNGKTPVVYASYLFRSLAYKWKISFNENAKNVAFSNELPEFNHNEFMGWTSHPVEKPYAVIDLVSQLDHPQVKKRFTVSDQLLSGRRPHALTVNLQGETVLQQMLWASVLGDFVGIYLALLNGVDPTPVALIEKLKAALA